MMREWFTRGRFLVRQTFRKRSRLSELEEELRFHVEQATLANRAAGMTATEARRQALIEFGGVERAREQCHEQRPGWWLGTVAQDARYALRGFRRNPGFTAIAAASLALAIGANTAIFSIAKNVLYDRLSVPHAEQMRLLRWSGDERCVVEDEWGGNSTFVPGGGIVNTVFSYPVYRELRAHNQEMQDLFAFKEDWMNATVGGNARRVQVEMVSGDYYQQLGVRPQLGRPIEPADDAVPGSGAMAVISDSMWEREFARSPQAIGQTMKLNDAVLTIVGVNPRGFGGASSVQQPADVMTPLAMQPLIHPLTMKAEREEQPRSAGRSEYVVARRDGPREAWGARYRGERRARRATEGRDSRDHERGASETLPSLVLDDGGRGLHFSSDYRYSKPVCVLLTLTGLSLLLACANIANLLLARGAQRQREMSVRLALGAGQRACAAATADGEPTAGRDRRRWRAGDGLSGAQRDSQADGARVGSKQRRHSLRLGRFWLHGRRHDPDRHFVWPGSGMASRAHRGWLQPERERADRDAPAQGPGRKSAGRIPDCALHAVGRRRGTVSAHAVCIEPG